MTIKEYDKILESRRVDFSKNPLTKYTEEELKSFVLEYSSLYEEHKNDSTNNLISEEDYWKLINLFNKLVNRESIFFYYHFEDWASNVSYLNKLLFESVYYYVRGEEICKFDRLTSLEDIVTSPAFHTLDPRIVKYLIKFLKNVDEAKMGS